ncbi:MAG: 50S ribosomal protein L22 [Chloroflexota bacterium]
MEVRAHTKYLPISSQKLRLVCDQVRGMDAEEALIVLKFMPQKGSDLVYKTLYSAISNAVNNFDMDREELVITQIFADEGPSMKRYKAGARGRYKPRVRRTAHLTVFVEEREYDEDEYDEDDVVTTAAPVAAAAPTAVAEAQPAVEEDVAEEVAVAQEETAEAAEETVEDAPADDAENAENKTEGKE